MPCHLLIMAKLLKDEYSHEFIENLSNDIRSFYSSFNTIFFYKKVFTDEWAQKELKQRMHHVTVCLHEYLPSNYPLAIKILTKVASNYYRHTALIFPHYVQTYGLHDYETSVKAMETLTQFGTCEFAVRPYILKYPKKMMLQLLKWSKHPNEHVRRLASESCRPMLPWAEELTIYRKDPTPTIKILENLKLDSSAYVRKSVANHLNDISKDHPLLIISLAKKWLTEAPSTKGLLKHALRTLLKAGNSKAIKLFGYGSIHDYQIQDFHIKTPKVKIEENLEFYFTIKSINNSKKTVRIEYVIYFRKQNGQNQRKVFKISETNFNFEKKILKTHSFKTLSTRRYYTGEHFLALQINGVELEKKSFILE